MRKEPGLRRAGELFADRDRLQRRAGQGAAGILDGPVGQPSIAARSASRARPPISASASWCRGEDVRRIGRQPGAGLGEAAGAAAAGRALADATASDAGARGDRDGADLEQRCGRRRGQGPADPFVQPEPGPVAVISFMSEITSTRHPDLVNEWMNEILSAEYQAMAANAPYFFGPTVKGVDGSGGGAADYTPSTPAEVRGCRRSTGRRSRRVRGAIVEQFDRLFAS